MNLSSTSASRRPELSSKQLAAIMIHKRPSPSCTRVLDGPKIFTPAGPPTAAVSLGRADRDTRDSLGRLVRGPFQMTIGGLPASGFLLRASALVVEWNMPRPRMYVSILVQSQELCTRSWPGFDEYDIDGGLQRSDTESSLLSSFLSNADIYGSSNCPSQRSLRHRSATACRIFWPNWIPGAGAWLLALPDSLESHIPPPLFRKAFDAAYACLSGPRTHTALSADKSWTNGVTTPWRAVVAGAGSLATIYSRRRFFGH